MKGDFSRDVFAAGRREYRVLMQQGRVQLDADWNEQAAIVLHRLETIVRDTFGAAAGPADRCGFALFPIEDEGRFGIGAGRYYVDGLLVENNDPQEFGRRDGTRLENDHAYIIYLDVWEEFIAPQQDPLLLDPALDGLDTTARTRVDWRVRAHHVATLPTHEEIADGWPYGYLGPALVGPRPRLAATVAAGGDASDPALGATPVGYTGAENQLYRVEIHDPGSASDGATFKWSRDNGAVAYAIRSVADKTVTLETSPLDAHGAFSPGDWVEICDDDDAGAREPKRGLFAVAHADSSARTVALKSAPGYACDPGKHPILRRWDQRSAPLPVIESADADDENAWTRLERGLAVRFAPAGDGDDAAVYRTGDYWMIPARTADGGSLLWPQDADGRGVAREPAGIKHRFAPLAGISISSSGKLTIDREHHDYRRVFRPLTYRP